MSVNFPFLIRFTVTAPYTSLIGVMKEKEEIMCYLSARLPCGGCNWSGHYFKGWRKFLAW